LADAILRRAAFSFFLAFSRRVAVQATILAGENAIQFFHQRKEFLVIVFDCDPRTEVVNLVTFFLVHGVAEVLQDWRDQVCSMSNAGKGEVPAWLRSG
jgi:hypothetical protein